MTSAIGAALRGSVLAGCVLAALSTTTITQQSSSAWGTLDNGKTVDRGTHTSHTTNQLPDGAVEPDLELEGRFGGGGLGFRGGFGSRRRPSQPSSTGVGQDPSLQAPSFGSPDGTSAGQAPSLPAPSFGSPGGTSAGQDPSLQAPSAAEDAAFSDFLGLFDTDEGHHRPGPVFPQRHLYPNVGLHGGYQRPWTSFQQLETELEIRGGFASRSPDDTLPVANAVPAGTSGPVTPPLGAPGAGAAGPAAPGLGGDGAVGVVGAPSFGPRTDQPQFSSLPPSAVHFTPREIQGGHVQHSSDGSVSRPGQPRVQSQHASVDSVFFRRADPAPPTAPPRRPVLRHRSQSGRPAFPAPSAAGPADPRLPYRRPRPVHFPSWQPAALPPRRHPPRERTGGSVL